jgi:primosomal protein N' (replication factor Y) (superfamily II helicase)
VFDYTVPPELEGELAVGSRVRVSLAGRRVAGWVTEDEVSPEPGVELRPVARSSGFGPPAALVDLAGWAAWRWAGPVTAFLGTASPGRVVRRLPEHVPHSPAGSSAAVTEAADHALDDLLAVLMQEPGRPLLARLPPDFPLLALVQRVVGSCGGNGTVLVLVPELAGAERLSDALERRGVPVARHPRGWDEAAAGWPVVVGTRAAAWSPPARLAAAIVLDAHDEAYREERAPTSEAWEVVVERCRRDGAPCLLVSATPTVVMHRRCRTWLPSRPVERGGWPVVEVVDQRHADPRTGLLSEALVTRARRLIGEGSATAERPIVCVLNRRGRARLLACGSCGELVRCHRCGGPSRQMETDLGCSRCGERRPALCAACGSTRLKVLRSGVSRVREELEALLGCGVAEVAGPTAEPRPGSRVVVGTEAVLHRIRRASLVAFLDLDQHLLAATYTAAETTLAMLSRAGRMVGGRRQRPSMPSVVLVQTRLPDHEVVLAAQHGDPGPLLEQELEARRQLQLPPWSALAVVSGPKASELVAELERRGTGPGGTLTIRQIEDDRWLVRAPTHQELCDPLAELARPRGRVRIEVDPRRI